MPYDEDVLGIVDTAYNPATWSTVSWEGANAKYCTGTALGTKLYFAPHDATGIGVYDTETGAQASISLSGLNTGVSTDMFCGTAAIGTKVTAPIASTA